MDKEEAKQVFAQLLEALYKQGQVRVTPEAYKRIKAAVDSVTA